MIDTNTYNALQKEQGKSGMGITYTLTKLTNENDYKKSKTDRNTK